MASLRALEEKMTRDLAGGSTRSRDPNRADERLRKEMQQHAGGAGKVIHAEMYEPAKGGGWVAVFDTEYAALKVHYKYRGSPGVRLGRSPTYDGWFVSTRSR